MNQWRLLKPEVHDPYMNMAIDEAILTAKTANQVQNTIRFYRWNPSAVSIGKFQKLENEVWLENCRKHGVGFVRRITGGGAVYHDARDEVTYSVVASKEDLEASDITEVYAKTYSGLAEALRILGIRADFNEGNAKVCPNLTVNGRKISGSSQSHKHGTVLQHGTLLINVDLEKMFTFLRVPWAKTCMEIVEVAKQRITSIKTELGKDIAIEQVSRALVEGFQNALGIELVEDNLSVYELDIARKLAKEKYASEKWNFRAMYSSA